jgi:hypothetical protein
MCIYQHGEGNWEVFGGFLSTKHVGLKPLPTINSFHRAKAAVKNKRTTKFDFDGLITGLSRCENNNFDFQGAKATVKLIISNLTV